MLSVGPETHSRVQVSLLHIIHALQLAARSPEVLCKVVCFLVRLIYATRTVLLTGLYLPDMETLRRLTALRIVPSIPSVLVDQGLV